MKVHSHNYNPETKLAVVDDIDDIASYIFINGIKSETLDTTFEIIFSGTVFPRDQYYVITEDPEYTTTIEFNAIKLPVFVGNFDEIPANPQPGLYLMTSWNGEKLELYNRIYM